MITILILNKSDDVKVLRYETEDTREAGRRFSQDWLNGKIQWESPNAIEQKRREQFDSRTAQLPLSGNAAKERLAYTLKETANLLGVSYTSVNRLLQRGLLKSSQAFRTRLIPRKEIERFLAETTSD